MAKEEKKQELLDAQSSVLEIMEANQLKKWSKISPRVFTPNSQDGNQVRTHKKTPFPINDELNDKIVLWVGDITQLGCQAIVHSTNENFTDRSPLSVRIMKKGGFRMMYHLKEQIRCCKTGDAKLSEGFDLPARFVVHTVGPKYDKKYHTAAEGALFSAYSKVLQLSREQNIRTLGLCPINSVRRGYPPHNGAHLAMRVVRRFMEKYSQDFELIIFAVEDVDVGIYELLLPLYFPRSEEEENFATFCLPSDIGGEEGEPVIPERQIRIGEKPTSSMGEDWERTIDLESGLDSSVAVGKSPFAKMQGDVDKRWTRPRTKSNIKLIDPISIQFERQHRYERLLRRAKTEEFKQLKDLRFFYSAGMDKRGRSILVFIGQRLFVDQFDDETVLSFIISILEPFCHKDFIVIYFHSMSTQSDQLSLNFLKFMFETLSGDPSYKINLKALFVLHATIWCRLASWWFTTFSETTIKDKLFFLGGVEFLKQMIPSVEQLQLPSSILQLDCKVTFDSNFPIHLLETSPMRSSDQPFHPLIQLIHVNTPSALSLSLFLYQEKIFLSRG